MFSLYDLVLPFPRATDERRVCDPREVLVTGVVKSVRVLPRTRSATTGEDPSLDLSRDHGL